MESKNTLLRLKKVLLLDKEVPNGFVEMLEAGFIELLEDYLEYDPKTVHIDLNLNEKGYYQLNFKVVAERIKAVNQVF